MNKAYTDPLIVKRGCRADAAEYLERKYNGAYGIVCDENTEYLAERSFPGADKTVYPGDSHATGENAERLERIISEKGYSCLVACGSGSVHDITRFACHFKRIPFVSFPTAPSVDGFVSGIAAMTISGRKISYPSTPPEALFADADIYETAPSRLTASGIGDIVGKYVSLFDWLFTAILTDETVEPEIYDLERNALMSVMNADRGAADYIEQVMNCLVLSGISIQLKGNSRPASGAEHHLSHLWEMTCINGETDALHGEKVGVSSLIVLEKYKSVRNRITLRPKPLDRDFLRPVFGRLTDGIIEENTPNSLAEITPSLLAAHQGEITELIDGLPSPDEIRTYLKSVGAKTTLAELGLPDTPDFARKSLEYAPYVRRRLTMLKVI